MDSQQARYDRVLLTVGTSLIAANLLLYVTFMRFWRPKLNRESIEVWAGKGQTVMDRKAWSAFHKDSSQLVLALFFHVWFGTCAVSGALAFGMGDTPQRMLGDRGALLLQGDVEFVRLQETAAFLGSVFGGLMVCYTFFWLLGWDKDPTALFHHGTFFAVTLVLARRSALPHSGLVAMAMEGSTPALCVMNLFRQLDGPLAEKVTLVSFGCFFVLFVLLRCVLFGRAALTVLGLRLFDGTGFPRHVPSWETDAVVVLWLAGWLLQLHWLRLMIKKVQRKFFPKKKTKAQ